MTRAAVERPDVRYVIVKGVRYLRVEDVALYFHLVAAGEETDVRRRIDEAVTNLSGSR